MLYCLSQGAHKHTHTITIKTQWHEKNWFPCFSQVTMATSEAKLRYGDFFGLIRLCGNSASDNETSNLIMLLSATICNQVTRWLQEIIHSLLFRVNTEHFSWRIACKERGLLMTNNSDWVMRAGASHCHLMHRSIIHIVPKNKTKQ